MKYSKMLLFFLILGLFLFTSVCRAQNRLTVEQWREDIKFLSEELPRRHLNLYHTSPKSRFDQAFANLYKDVPNLEDHEIIVELSRITAMIGDGHSGIRLYSDPKIAFSSLPIRMYMYEDGLFIRKIEREYAEFVGARVLKVGGQPVDKAIKAVTPLIARDNEMWAKFYAPYFLATPEILHALRIIDNKRSVTFEVEKNGQRNTFTLKPKGKLVLVGHAQTETGVDQIDFVDALDPSKPTPLWLKGDPEDSYWFEFLKDSGTLYFRYNEVMHKREERIPEFAKRMFDFVDKNDVRRFVIDMRWNRGGSNRLSLPFLRGIMRSKKIDQRGNLFLIIGRRTFSAAQYFVNELEMYTNVIVVGEPTASHVNPYGDNYKIMLPNSGIKVRASYLRFQQMGPRDKRKWTGPDIAAELTSDDYRNGIDPALEAILNYSVQPPLADRLREKFVREGLPAAMDLFHDFKADKKNKFVDTERIVNRLGYGLLARKQVSEAISVLKLNVRYYPKRANPYDSLGEAYEQAGQFELAKQNYETAYKLAMELNDADLAEAAKEKLDRVSAKIKNR